MHNHIRSASATEASGSGRGGGGSGRGLDCSGSGLTRGTKVLLLRVRASGGLPRGGRVGGDVHGGAAGRANLHDCYISGMS